MDFKDLLAELKTAHENLKTLEEKEAKIIKEEVKMLNHIAKYLFQITTTKTIAGEEALLIFVFPKHNKEWISHEVYYTKSGQVTYQVYDEEKYKGYVPDANVVNGYVYSSPEKFLYNVPFEYIYDFFVERIDVLYEDAQNTISNIEKRERFLEQMNRYLK